MAENPLLLTLEAAAKLAGLSRSGLYQIIAQGGGPGPVVRIGRRARLPRRAVEAWVDKLTAEAEAAGAR